MLFDFIGIKATRYHWLANKFYWIEASIVETNWRSLWFGNFFDFSIREVREDVEVNEEPDFRKSLFCQIAWFVYTDLRP